MKKKTTHKPTAGKFSLLRQLCNFIPPHLAPQLARATGVEDHARKFSPWSHVVSLLYAQITHSLGLNDVCDALRLHSGPLSALRGATRLAQSGCARSASCKFSRRKKKAEVSGRHAIGSILPAFEIFMSGTKFPALNAESSSDSTTVAVAE